MYLIYFYEQRDVVGLSASLLLNFILHLFQSVIGWDMVALAFNPSAQVAEEEGSL